MQKTKKIIIILFCICIITASFSGCLSRPETLEETADKMYSSYLQSEGVPSASVLVVKDGEKLLEKSYGLRNIKAGERATPNSSYRLACVTKPFTSMGILLLWEKGLIDLDMPVKEILTDFPKSAEKATIRHLLQNSSGLPDYQDLWPSYGAPLRDKEVYELIKKHDQNRFFPGSDVCLNSDTAFAVLALVIEQVSGMSYQEYMAENIFKPLGMNHTVAFVDGYNTVPERAYGTVWRDDRYVVEDQYAYSPVLGDGGIYSSIHDLYLWDQALAENKLISADRMKEAMKTAKPIKDSKGVSYSCGWYVEEVKGHQMIQTSGGTIGFSHMFIRFPNEKVTVVILTNCHNSWNVLRNAEKLAFKAMEESRFD